MEDSFTLSTALKLLSSKDFITSANEVKDDKIVLISLKISENLTDQLNVTSFAHNFSEMSAAIISFESIVDDHEVEIFWKSLKDENFKLLKIVDDIDAIVVAYCKRFLHDAIKNQELSEYCVFSDLRMYL